MKKSLIVVMTVLFAFSLAGCFGAQEPEVEEDDGEWGMDFGPSWAQSPPTEEGKLYGIANAQSRNLQTAIQRAELRATNQIAQQLGQSIQSWQEDYVQEMGEAADAEILSSFEQLTERVIDEELHGVREEERAVDQVDGVFDAWVMVSVDLDQVSQQFDEMERLETEFSREQARQRMDESIDGRDSVAEPEGQ